MSYNTKNWSTVMMQQKVKQKKRPVLMFMQEESET